MASRRRYCRYTTIERPPLPRPVGVRIVLRVTTALYRLVLVIQRSAGLDYGLEVASPGAARIIGNIRGVLMVPELEIQQFRIISRPIPTCRWYL